MLARTRVAQSLQPQVLPLPKPYLTHHKVGHCYVLIVCARAGTLKTNCLLVLEVRSEVWVQLCYKGGLFLPLSPTPSPFFSNSNILPYSRLTLDTLVIFKKRLEPVIQPASCRGGGKGRGWFLTSRYVPRITSKHKTYLNLTSGECDGS